MKVHARVLLIFVAVLALCIAAFIAFGSLLFSDPMCGGNEEAAIKMRTLPQRRLESLYRYAKELHGDGSFRPSVVFGVDEVPIPKELADLNPRGIHFWGDTLGVHISGCMDDKVYLFVEGLDPEGGQPRILFSPGERQESEILWQR